jgi:excisionase family DNA binding protein
VASDHPVATARLLEGRLVLVIDQDHARLVDALIARALTAAYDSGKPPMLAAHRICEVARWIAAARFFDAVPAEVRTMDGSATEAAPWLTTAEAAKLLEMSQRGVRKRIERGTIESYLQGGRRMVRLATKGPDGRQTC